MSMLGEAVTVEPQGVGLGVASKRSAPGLFSRLHGKLLCVIGAHDWTCATEEGIKVGDIPGLRERFKDAPVDAFYEYAQMYCRRCSYIYDGRR